jgi:hypothetical protein
MFTRNPKRYLPAAILAALVLLAGSLAAALTVLEPASPALAAPPAQVQIYTPTPLPDGRIVYKVQENDTLLAISLTMGVSLEDLRNLNDLTSDMITPGQELILGMAQPPAAVITPGPSATPTPILPTATIRPGTGNLCILLFNDVNGNSSHQEEEPSISGGAISIGNRSGSVSLTATTTDAIEPQCFDKVAEGDYTISVAVPEGYNPTTVMNYAVTLRAGDITYLDFGAQASSSIEVVEPLPVANEQGKSPMLGIIGGIFLLFGIALAVFAGKLIRS